MLYKSSKPNNTPMPIKVTHLGGEICVTGSCHLIETTPDAEDAISILIDCGTAYGADPQLPFDQFPVLPAAMDYLFLTHAHIDHIGRIPDLIDAGFQGEIICTHGTAELLLPMLRDAMSFSAPPSCRTRTRPMPAISLSSNPPTAIVATRSERPG